MATNTRQLWNDDLPVRTDIKNGHGHFIQSVHTKYGVVGTMIVNDQYKHERTFLIFLLIILLFKRKENIIKLVINIVGNRKP
jgi:hypothetical protein